MCTFTGPVESSVEVKDQPEMNPFWPPRFKCNDTNSSSAGKSEQLEWREKISTGPFSSSRFLTSRGAALKNAVLNIHAKSFGGNEVFFATTQGALRWIQN